MSQPLSAPQRSPSRRIGGHVAALASGALAMRVVTLVTQVLIARIVGPTALGALAVAQALGLFTGILTDGGLNAATLRRIVREPRRVGELASITLFGQLQLATAGALLMVAVALLGPWNSQTTLLIVLVAPGLFCAALNLSYVLTANEMMGTVAFFRAFGAIAPALVSVALVAWTHDVKWVAIATVAGLLLNALLVQARARARLRFRYQRVRQAQVVEAMRGSAPFLISSFLQIAPSLLVTVLVAGIRGARDAGIYSAVWQLIFATLVLAGIVVEAIYPELVRRWDASRAEYERLVRIAVRLVVRVALPVAAFGVVAGPELVQAVFGERYGPSGPLLRIMIGVMPLGFVWVILGQAMLAANQERALMRRSAALGALTLAATPVAVWAGGLIAVAWTVLGLAAVQVLVFASAPAAPTRQLGRDLAAALVYFVVPLAAALAATAVETGGARVVVAAVAIVVAALACELAGRAPTLRDVRALGHAAAERVG